MHLHAALIADLNLLNDTDDGRAVDLVDTFRRLAKTAELAVQSFLGQTVTAAVGADLLRFTELKDPASSHHIASSLHLRPHVTNNAWPGSENPAIVLIFYAGVAGAFVDLAADISWSSGGRGTEVVLDQHLVPPDWSSPSGLQDLAIVNQAVGVLLAHGYSPDDGREQLDLRARTLHISRSEAAQRLLEDLATGIADIREKGDG